MTSLLRKLLYPLLLPCGALFLAAAVLIHSAEPSWFDHPLVRLAPALGTVGGVMLAWRLNRGRVMFALLIVFAGHLALRRFHAGASSEFVFAAAATLLPLNLAVIVVLPERGLFTIGGLGRVALIFSQIAIAFWGHQQYGPLAQRWLVQDWPAPVAVLPNLLLPHLSIALFVVAATVLGLRWVRHPTALDSGFVWSLGAVLLALLQADPSRRSAYFALAGWILIAALIEAFHVLAFRDELTGLPTRRALNEALAGAGKKFAVAMVDVDHFKRVNDRHGHDVGDQVLKMLAGHLSRIPGGGRAYRYGGEEFTLLFRRKDPEEVLPHLELLREAIAAQPFRLRGFLRPRRKPGSPLPRAKAPKSLRVTVSIGLAGSGQNDTPPTEVIKSADRALYRAKRGGRNRVWC